MPGQDSAARRAMSTGRVGLTPFAGRRYGRALMDVTWIASTPALAEWAEGIGGGPLAVDTEADSFHHYREKLCLLQMSVGGRHALVDPLASIELSAVRRPFEDAAVRKILHGADYDVRLLARDFGIVLAGLVDTMVAARLLGEPALGLAALLAKHLDVSLDKSHQRADWSKRPLSDTMRDYAVEDTRYLEALASILEARLHALSRTEWLREECERLCAVRWRDPGPDDREPFRRLKGARGLDRRGLAVLRELWSWRDAMARKRDKAPFRILHDETLVTLARTPPSGIGDLTRVRGFPDFLVRSPSAHDLLDAARRGAACPESMMPEIRTRPAERPDPAVEARFDRIKDRRDEVARDLGVDPSVVLPRAVVLEMAKRWEAGEDPWMLADLRRWQASLLRPLL